MLTLFKSKTKNILIITLTLSFFIADFSALYSAPRRRYNPDRTRERAIELIKSKSEEVSQIAGLEKDSVKQEKVFDLEEDSELLSDSVEVAETGEIGDRGEDIEELEEYDDVEVSMDNFRTLWLAYVEEDEDDIFTESGIRKDEIMEVIMDWLGTPYRFGGTSRKSIDCSAFTRTVIEETAQSRIPRTARWQFKVGQKIEKIKDLEFGDLIFFHTRSYAYASHCGIYLGDNLFAHASSRHGVTVSSLESTYYNNRFIGGRRLRYDDIKQYSIETVEEESNYGG